jgi:ribonuclease D
MADEFFETERRSFKPISIPELSIEAREAVNAALQAMWSWRNETANTSEKYGKQVIKKMATAAVALGWPQQIVDAALTQMQSTTEMQIKTMDSIMDAWEEQLKLPNPTTASPSALLSKLKSLPGFGSTGIWPSTDAFQKGAVNPLQFWMQLAEQWQKSWADTMTYWGKVGKPH